MDWAPDPGTYTWFLGTIRFTVYQLIDGSGQTEISFVDRGQYNGALWMLDGVLEDGTEIHIGDPVVLTR